MSAWTKETPTAPGHYFFRSAGERDHRTVKVWRHRKGYADQRLFTNEDGGALVTDEELYRGGEWQAFEMPEPKP